MVQQQAGVQLKGGIDGGKSDPYEQHADAVADKVVRGESAEELLGPGRGSAKGVVVQRKSKDDDDKKAVDHKDHWVNAHSYLEQNHIAVNTAIHNHLAATRLPQPDPRMAWKHEQEFWKSLIPGLAYYLTWAQPFDILQLLFPGDPYPIVDQMRPIAKSQEKSVGDNKDQLFGGRVGPDTWVVPIGQAIAGLVEQTLIGSIYRLGPRFLEVSDANNGKSVKPEQISRSHPIDRAVVIAMCVPSVFDITPPNADPKALKKKPTEPHGRVQPVTLTWLNADGKRPELWNWVRANPETATAEDVSAKLFDHVAQKDNESQAEYYASFLTSAPPLFGIPAMWARTFEETRNYRPKDVAADSSPDLQLTTLAGSSVADEQALTEGGGASTASAKPAHVGQVEGSGEHDRLVADVMSQANYLENTLEQWKLGKLTTATLDFLKRRTKDGADGAKWVPVLKAQNLNLSLISEGMLKLDSTATELKLPKTGPEAKPLYDILDLYGRAAGASHLNKTCSHLLASAANAQAGLAVQGLQTSARSHDSMVDTMRNGVRETSISFDRNETSSRAVGLSEEAQKMQTRLMRGEKVSADQIADLQLRLEENGLEARLAACDGALRELQAAADSAGEGLAAWFAALPSKKFRHLNEGIEAIRSAISDIRFDWNNAKAHADDGAEDGLDHTLENKRAAVKDANKRFEALSRGDGDHKSIKEFLEEGASVVKWQSVRTACVRLAAVIGISLVGGMLVGAAMRGVAGMMMGAEGAAAVESLSLGGRAIYKTVEIGATGAVNGLGQAAVYGVPKDGSVGESILENLLMEAGTQGVLKVLNMKGEQAKQLEEVAGSFFKTTKVGVALAEVGAVSGHMIMGIAVGYVAHKMVTGEKQPPPSTIQEWLMQGAGVAMGRYVGQAMHASAVRQTKLKSMHFDPALKLAHEAEALDALAKKAEAHPEAKDAMELLEKRHRYLSEEMKVFDELEKSPEKMKEAGLSKRDVTRGKAELKHQLADIHTQGFGEVPMRMAGMRELIPGHLWSGTYQEVDTALMSAKESGIVMHLLRGEQGKLFVEVEGKRIQIEERIDGTPHEMTAKATAEPATHTLKPPPDATQIHKEHPQLHNDAGSPPEVMLGGAQRAQAINALEHMSGQEYGEFNALANATSDPVARGFLYKAAAAGHSISEIKWLAGEMAGKDRGWLIDNLTLGDPRATGGGLKQQFSTSCNAAMTTTIRGNYDPVFALRLRIRNMGVGEADDHDPSMNMHQADLEKDMLESDYAGNNPHSPKPHKGVAKPRDEQGVGRFADDLLNDQSAVTGMSFHPLANPSGHQVALILDQALTAGMQVPLVIGNVKQAYAHYVLVQQRRVSGTNVEFNIHDPWTGQSTWVSAHDIANDSIPGNLNKVGSIEVPSSMPLTPAGGAKQTSGPSGHGATHGGPELKTEGLVEPEETPGGGKRITTRTPGVFEAVDPNKKPPNIEIDHENRAAVEADIAEGKKTSLMTHISTIDKNNQKVVGDMKRSYDPQTKSMVLISAFLPDALPSRVPADKPLDPANPQDGMPLAALIQMQQLKIFGVSSGELKHVKMSTVLNVVTIAQVEIAARARGVRAEQLPFEVISQMHTMQYAETPLVQSGHRLTSAKIVGGGRDTPIGTWIEYMRSDGYGKAADKATQLLRDHNIGLDEKLLSGFDIEAELAPEDPNAAKHEHK